MNSEELNINEILKVEQLPKLYEDLKKIGVYLEEKLKGIDDIECTEENKQEVKTKRTLINNTKTVLENKRKEIKSIILKPYDEFEIKYKDEALVKINNALETLDKKIAFIEDKQKENIKELCENLFNEYSLSKDINFVTFDNLNLKITLGLATEKGSLTKKTKDIITEYINKRVDDIKLIEMQKYSDEILVDYKKHLDVTKAIADVNNRHIELDKMKEEQEAKKEQKLNDEVMLNKIDEVLKAPKIEKVDEKDQVKSGQAQILEAPFLVRTTSTECLKEMKEVAKKYDAELILLIKKEGVYHE